MTKYIVVFVLGIVAGTVGLTGLAHILDKGVSKVQDVAKEAAK